ncbi:MAG: aminopeptidase N [Alphaproteobacteria bacterium]|nr:aminopeptidase N [Alphaproteobacteria bacterium]
MKTDTPTPIQLKDYRPSNYLIEQVDLDVRLSQQRTHVTAKMRLVPGPDGDPADTTLRLDGEALELVGLMIDGEQLPAGAYQVDEKSLTITQAPSQPFTLTVDTVCDPSANTALSGLYRSNDIYCTQCEAEGFRRITYYLDRPDVLAKFTTRIEARRSEAPVLLSNGNLIESGTVEGTERHFAVWQDPFPKPSYLFALVGGDLACVKDTFTTKSGRRVDLAIYVEPGKEDRCDWAMTSLKESMRWDEERFGCEYDLDIFMIVAVSDFNMGAMENKGLNIFNDKYILARPDTATDQDYANIEAIIAHEYFHNWTGNRITCRDWFQLCLKEGLTVFRDQEFSSDLRSRPVKRISDVQQLRAHQFPEDAGPLSHPVRPNSYIEINNFYTATVYEKGAELCRMLQTILGEDAFREAMDLYLQRHDGDAATVDDFIKCMEDASGRDLSQFFLWYEQAGTPALAVAGTYDSANQRYELKISQATGPTPGQPSKKPFHIPLRLGLMSRSGSDVVLPNSETGLLEVTEAEQTFSFEGISEEPVLSINREFSAPVKITSNVSSDDLLFLLAHDSDPFNRWEAGQTCMKTWLESLVEQAKAGQNLKENPDLTEALRKAVNDDTLEDAFKIKLLSLPGESGIANHIGRNVDPGAIHVAHQHAKRSLGASLERELEAIYQEHSDAATYSPDAQSAGRRSLRNGALDYLVHGAPAKGIALAARQAESSTNLNDTMAALLSLAPVGGETCKQALDAFYDKHKADHLLVDKWLMLNALSTQDSAIDDIRALTKHAAFSMTRPNKVRSLIGSFSMMNPVRYNDATGAGYALVADIIAKLDEINPQISARMSSCFKSWRMLEPGRREKAKAELERLAAHEPLSRDLGEMIARTLKA